MAHKIIEYNLSKGLELEFGNLEGWEEFDHLVNILEKNISCKIIEKYDSLYSRFCLFEKENLNFRLIHHPETGNSLLAIIQSDENNKVVRTLAHEVLRVLSDD